MKFLKVGANHLNDVWGYAFMGNSNVVDIRISGMCEKKLHSCFPDELEQSRGIGLKSRRHEN